MHAYTQTDSTKKKRMNINRVVGVDIGYSDYDNSVGCKSEANVNYIFNPGYFCLKLQAGLTPNTNFGLLTKVFGTLGFSTKINRFISWHLLIGLGRVSPSKSINDERAWSV